MNALRLSDHRALIERVVKRVASRDVEVHMPSDPVAWCASRALPNVRFATAFVTSAGAWGIVFAPHISAAEAIGILSGMEFRGFIDAKTLLASTEKFVAHLTLHELAHLENHWGQEFESECDQWAFEKLPHAL